MSRLHRRLVSCLHLAWLHALLWWGEYRTRRLAAEIESQFGYPSGWLLQSDNARQHREWLETRQRWQVAQKAT